MSRADKLDYSLLQALLAFEESGAKHDASAGISVSLRFEGDIADIEALGFEPFAVYEREARGIVWFKDIAALVAHPGVRWIAAGDERQPDTDTAVRDIKARADTIGNARPGGTGLWHADTASGAFFHNSNDTGLDVIVAVIDSGIDYTHPAFLKTLAPTKVTRILRIWDQGLVATAAGDSPAPALLESNPLTYGVEYDDAEIEASINGGGPLLHKDCLGHGTHVAAIAAGGVQFASGGDAQRVGVAPDANIIAVKLLDNPSTVKYGTAAAPGAVVGFSQRFRDAVLYCLRTAAALAKPVVINMSFGSPFEPGDGLDEDAIWLDERLDPARPADGVLQFPQGAIAIRAAGNDGDATFRQTARFTVPAGGLTVPLELVDTRGSLRKKWKNCKRQVHEPQAGVIFWYRRATPATAVKFAVKLPHQGAFSADQEVGNNFSTSFRVNPPWPFTTTLHPPATTRHTVFLHHEDTPPAAHPAGTVRRQRARLHLRPKRVGSNVLYIPGIYEVRITAPAGTEVFAMCLYHGWAPKKGVYFRIAEEMQNGDPLPAAVSGGLTTDSSAVDAMGRHVVTVASYNDTNGKTGDADHHAIADSSSQGPLRDFSDPPGSLPLIATKPELAGPGVKINAALSSDTDKPPLKFRTAAWRSGVRFTDMSGTSMAAPMVAGVVALMLDKKPDLNITDTLTHLKAAAAGRPGARPVSPPDPPSAVTNAFGSGMVDALDSHTRTP